MTRHHNAMASCQDFLFLFCLGFLFFTFAAAQVQWLDDVRFVISSDKAKKYQSYRWAAAKCLSACDYARH
jgi:hypothetical protein